MLLAYWRHGLREHAIDAELDDHRVVPSLDMDVRGAPLQGGEDGRVHQTDDGTGVPGGGQLVDRKRLFHAGGFILADDVEGESFAGLFEYTLRLLGLFENVADLLQRGDLGDNALLQQQADLIDHHELAGIGNRNRQPSIRGLFEGNEVVAEHQFDWNFLEQLMVKLKVGEIHELTTVAPGDVLRALQIGDGIARGDNLPAIPAVREE